MAFFETKVREIVTSTAGEGMEENFEEGGEGGEWGPPRVCIFCLFLFLSLCRYPPFWVALEKAMVSHSKVGGCRRSQARDGIPVIIALPV